MLVALMLMLAAPAGDNSARAEFTDCVKGTLTRAAAAKIDAAGYAAFARETCATATSGFRAALIDYDMKAGWTRKKAEPDADQQIGDYVDEMSDRYKDQQTAAK